MQNLADFNFVINGDESIFKTNDLEWIGYCVTSRGVNTLQSNIYAIMYLVVISTYSKLRRILEAADFYRKLISRYTEIVKPINYSKNTEWCYSEKKSSINYCLIKKGTRVY